MRKRIFLYGGAIVWTLALFIILGDRHVTEVVTPLDSPLVRFFVILAVNVALGWIVRVAFLRKPVRLT